LLYRLNPSQFWNRYWRLGRKIESQGGKPTANDCRMAAILRGFADRCSAAGHMPEMITAVDNLEGVIESGRKDLKARIASAEASAHLGA